MANNAEHYRELMERHLADSTRYQAQLYHAWRVIREQQKGLKRQARKLKRLREELIFAQGTGLAAISHLLQVHEDRDPESALLNARVMMANTRRA